MKITSIITGKTFKTIGLVLALSALPLLLSGCATSRNEQGAVESINDQGVSSRVRAALADDTQYKYGGVTVETYKGTVQLNGYVNSRDQKNRAGDLARRVTAVRDVVNNITVQESLN